ncbi:SPOR domain-containing protein [uncultured Sphingomonas sp.]|uniref:SPOR domain-containing protein n=1 Tax=uncultured Sphingomonas sp. TaxID=158754 RepID=UPI0025D53952|nr:SPOR domain-containing protein [uncultured Sphingomonas sp.]
MSIGSESGGRPVLGEDDRLPWLESADDDYREGPSLFRILAIAIIVLALIATAVWAYKRFGGSSGTIGSGELITAQDGDYKVKPDTPGGMKVDGQGDSVFRTSEGATATGAIDTRAVPEAPVNGKTATPAAKPTEGSARVVAAVPPAPSGRLTAQAPGMALPKATAGGGGGALVQLGSFPSEAAANTAWEALSKRFAYVANLGKSIEKADVKGATVYRLRVNAGSNGNATTICGRLKVAGEACFVPN